MKAYSLIVIIFACCVCTYTSVEIMPECKKNISNFGYGINFKYEGMLLHSFDRFYVVITFIVPSVNDLKFSIINSNKRCDYLQKKNRWNQNAKEYISDLMVYCKWIVPFVHYYKEQISSFNCTAHNILTNKIFLILPNLLKGRKEKKR